VQAGRYTTPLGCGQSPTRLPPAASGVTGRGPDRRSFDPAMAAVLMAISMAALLECSLPGSGWNEGLLRLREIAAAPRLRSCGYISILIRNGDRELVGDESLQDLARQAIAALQLA
jgi:hypothetical protein